MKKNFTKIVLDILMAITFALLMEPRVLNGLPFHEIAGLVIGVAVLTHIGLNYQWVKNTTLKIFDSKLPKKTRFSYMLNILLLISMSAIIITGILISKVVTPNLAIKSHMIRELHGLSADVTIALVGLHVALHWQWVMSVWKKMFKSKQGSIRKGVLVSAVLSLAILAGGMQWFSSSASANTAGFEQKQMQQASNVSDTNSKFQGPPPGDFGDRHGDGDFGGHGRGGGSPFLVILNYFAIFAAIIIPAYYIEKRYFRRKRKSQEIAAS